MASDLVSHYLDHIQPAIDRLATEGAALFKGVDPLAAPEEAAEGEHSLARMACFQRFRALVVGEVDRWCRENQVPEELLHRDLAAAKAAALAGKETNGTILLELLAAVDDFGAFAAYMAGETSNAASGRAGYAG
ncbi:unnamed protein product [Effrenium voratum]|nr:unnamed protein product [Effrenium voratum]